MTAEERREKNNSIFRVCRVTWGSELIIGNGFFLRFFTLFRIWLQRFPVDLWSTKNIFEENKRIQKESQLFPTASNNRLAPPLSNGVCLLAFFSVDTFADGKSLRYQLIGNLIPCHNLVVKSQLRGKYVAIWVFPRSAPSFMGDPRFGSSYYTAECVFLINISTPLIDRRFNSASERDKWNRFPAESILLWISEGVKFEGLAVKSLAPIWFLRYFRYVFWSKYFLIKISNCINS